jgi:hypothetical protein
MKTKTFLLVCLFLGIGFTQLSGQTKSVPFEFSGTSEDLYLENPVYCSVNGEEVDRLALDYWTIHGVNHYQDGILVFTNSKLSGQCHSIWSGEVFTYQEIDKTIATGTTYHANFNLNGDQGHHYIATYVIDNEDWQYILTPLVIRAICNENGPKKK